MAATRLRVDVKVGSDTLARWQEAARLSGRGTLRAWVTFELDRAASLELAQARGFVPRPARPDTRVRVRPRRTTERRKQKGLVGIEADGPAAADLSADGWSNRVEPDDGDWL